MHADSAASFEVWFTRNYASFLLRKGIHSIGRDV
jgi:hypothetical protein